MSTNMENSEEIYMKLSLGYGEQIAAITVCKLKKALNRLKQLPGTYVVWNIH